MRGTLFPAKIIRKSRDKTKLKVEYNKVKAKIDGKISRRKRHQQRNEGEEEVDVALIRPLPPQESNYCCFKLGDIVDGFCGWWWEGVITDVMKDWTFVVYFRFAKEKFKFESEELRLHREWVKDSWLPPLQQESPFFLIAFVIFIFYLGVSLFNSRDNINTGIFCDDLPSMIILLPDRRYEKHLVFVLV